MISPETLANELSHIILASKKEGLKWSTENMDINKVIKMCLIPDLGESITGDIPAFLKSDDDEAEEDLAIENLISMLPSKTKDEFKLLFFEMKEMRTNEAKLYKALDNIEALISHNEADISTWLPREYEDNLTYGQKNSDWSNWTKELRETIRQDSIKKICEAGK